MNMITFKVLNCVFLLSFFIIKIKAFIAKTPLEHESFEEWAESPSSYQTPQYVSSPPVYVIVTDTIVDGCKSKNSCQILLNEMLLSEKNVQNTTKLSNFYISSNGDIFSGHKWNSRVNNFNNCGYESSYIEITFIANAAYSTFETVQIRIAQRLLEYGLVNKLLSESYILLGAWQLGGKHSKWTPTNQNLIRMWPHWSSETNNQCIFIP